MNLSFVTETFPPEINGVAMTFGHLITELARRDHAVTVWRPHRRDRAQADGSPGFRERTVPGMPIPGYAALRLGFPAYRQLSAEWRQRRPDLVHVVTEGPLGASAITVARRLGIPVTSSFHTNFHAYTRHYGVAALRGVALAWLRRVHNRTRRTFAPTRQLADELAAVGFRRLGVFSRGVDLDQFSPRHRSAGLRLSWSVRDDAPVFLHAGRMAAEKNFPLLLRAFAAVRAANPATVFVLVGDGPQRPQLQRAWPNAVFTGFIPRAELARVYASADVYLHASTTETFGNVLTEAMASGLAVAAFDYAAAREFVRDQRNGLALPPGHDDAFIAGAVALATRPELRDRLRVFARDRLLDQSWSRVTGRFESDLREVLREQSPEAASA